MNTYSHGLVAAVLARPLKKRFPKGLPLPKFKTGAFILGSILPDIPLTVTAIGCIIYDIQRGAISLSKLGAPPHETMRSQTTVWKLFDDWFFNNPIVISIQNVFHSPLLITLYIALGFWAWRKGRKWGAWVFWLACAMMLHTLADIPLHADDGPLLLYPLNWSLRFESPLSYWDPDHYGREWARIELLLDIILVAYLLGGWLWRRLQRTPIDSTAKQE